MREFLIYLFIAFCVLFVIAGAILWFVTSSSNKKVFNEFALINETKYIGSFNCDVNKNFLSPSNQNFAFKKILLFNFKNGVLIRPTTNILGITFHLKPFILSEIALNLKNIKVYKPENILKKDKHTLIKIRAQYNTFLELLIYNSDDIIDEYYLSAKN